MERRFVILHFGPLLGGFAKRMELLVDALSAVGRVDRIHTLPGLWRLFRSRSLRRGHVSVIVYCDLMAPLVALLKCIRRDLDVTYMVRGDQVTWARHQGRRFRAWTARVLQKFMRRLGCRFVFASDDLHDLFRDRLGEVPRARVLPNTLGKRLPPIRPFDGRVAVVGDFRTVKNVEHVLETLADSGFRVDLYGNTSLPERWRRPWLHAHGKVDDLTTRLGRSTLVVLASVSEGFPNVLLDALEAGCAVAVHREFPFRRLPVAEEWRFELQALPDADVSSSRVLRRPDLKSVLKRLRSRPRDFKRDNPELFRLVESDWRERVWQIFEDTTPSDPRRGTNGIHALRKGAA